MTLKRLLFGLLSAYLGVLFTWFGLYAFTGDSIRYVGLTNYVVQLYFFLLIPLSLVIIWLRSRALGLAAILAALIFLNLWGHLFTPYRLSTPLQNEPLTVMTFNVLGMHGLPQPSIEVIRDVDADVVFLQELGPLVAAAMATELLEPYPHQILNPGPGPEGMGLLSKLPLSPTDLQLPHDWVGEPQLVEIVWQDQVVLLVNFHTYSTDFMPLGPLNANFDAREAQAQALADLSARSDTPLIVAGDANAGPLNEAYKIIAGELDDAWAVGGFGFGHTFPGSDLEFSDRPSFLGISAPQWMWRIDYVFFSNAFELNTVSLAPFDGASDHRGVIAELVLRSPND
jgi:endonuclease/exonuclease/phosphatase (EEP) superfamily protein YafD